MPNALQIADPRGDPDNPLTQGSPTWADAYSQTTDALGMWLAEQRAKMAQTELWPNPAGGVPREQLGPPGDWIYGSFNRIPNYNPPGTYTGALPTPDMTDGQQGFPSGQASKDYSRALQLLQQDGAPPEQLNQLLQILYQRKRT